MYSAPQGDDSTKAQSLKTPTSTITISFEAEAEAELNGYWGFEVLLE
jgi:hypothetical protein